MEDYKDEPMIFIVAIKNFIVFLLHKIYRRKSITEIVLQKGVKMGGGNDISSEFWDAAEPCLIEIGSYCQITKGVFLHMEARMLHVICIQSSIIGESKNWRLGIHR